MTFDCSEYFTALRFIYTSTLIANFRENVSWHNQVFGTIMSPMGPLARLVFSDAMQKERNMSRESLDL